MAGPTKGEIEALAGKHPMQAVMEANGVDLNLLVEKLAEELDAEKTKIVKVEGNVLKKGLPPGVIILSKTRIGRVVKETLLGVNMVNWQTRQRARMDAQKLLDLYPAAKHELEHKGLSMLGLIEEEDGNTTRPPHLQGVEGAD